ncbi:MAG: glycosyltransferase family A protein [Candidatus Omnitrophica bacterium]|nr:glycosyltransferase family A protein [Candidatus Omnitrophota bacterium]
MSNNLKSKDGPFVSVIICTQNRREYLKDYSLSSVLESSYPNYEVIVIDDASKDGTEEFLNTYKDITGRLKVVRNKVSKGTSYARNVGVFHAQGEIIAFIDDDCLVDKNWLSELVTTHLKDETLMAIGGFSYDGHSDKKAYFPYDGIFGCNMSFKKEVFNRFLFDKNIFFHRTSHHEETDLINRIKDHGFRTGYANKAVVRHFSAPAAYRKINSKIGSHVNWIYFKAKKLPLALYYYKLFKRSYQMYKIIKRLHSEGVLSFLNTWREIIWANCVLLFELPLKAKFANWHEERAFIKGVERSTVLNFRHIFLFKPPL